MLGLVKNISDLLFGRHTSPASPYSSARRKLEVRMEAKRMVTDTFMMSAGVLSAGFGLKGFLIPNHFLDGGATGISLLIYMINGWYLPLVLVCINLPFVAVGIKAIGQRFALKTTLCIVGLGLCTAFIPYPTVTDDKLLVAIFGGFFLGAGIGLAVRGGAVLDGTEVLAIAVSKRTGLTIGDVLMIINILIFSLAAWLLSVETSLYAMLTYLAASKTVDFVIEGIEEYTAVTIISVKADKIREVIINKMGRGVTVYKGERGHGKSGERLYDMKIIYTVITRLEVGKMKLEVTKVDPNAFVVMSSVKDMKGGMIKKRRLK